MKKYVFYSELTYLFGMILLALGSTLLVCANFGVSVVVAPAYLIHLKLSKVWSFVSFGVAEYIMQAMLLLLLIAAVRRFHWSYLFSFVTALFYGAVLDVFMWMFSSLDPSFGLRLLLFSLGVLISAVGVSFVLHTYISPAVYELLIKELALKYRKNTAHAKLVYDGCSCLLAILLSICFFGFWPLYAVGIGTVFCAFVNGRLIYFINRFLNHHFELRPYFPKLERIFAPPPFHPETTTAEAGSR